MKKQTLFFLIIIIIGIGMIIRTFFGGKGESPTSHNTPGIIESINNSGNISTNDTGVSENLYTGTIKNDTGDMEIDNPEVESGNITKSVINIIMPQYFYTPGLNKFSKDLYNNYQIKLNFKFINNLNNYRDLLSDPNLIEADLFLFPYDRHEIVKTLQFSPINDIQGIFDKLILPITKKEKIGFLPFAVDPMITYSSTKIPHNNFSEISNLTHSRESNIQFSFPLFFGITNEDYDNKGFIREYQDIVRYALLHYFQKYKDSRYLSTRINSNSQDNEQFQNYNTENLNQIESIITQPECRDFPSICFQLYNFVGIRFGFLSDQDIIQNFFSHKKSNFENLSTYPMPFYSIESPIRIRGRGISPNIKDSDTINAINTFFVQYINDHNNYDLRNSTLSVFQKEGISLSDNPYIGSRGYILETGGDYINSLRNSNSFRQLLDYQISASNFLKK